MCIIIVILILRMACANPWPVQSYQHQHQDQYQQQVFMSQMSRDNSEPVKTGYVYSQMNNNPAKLKTFGKSSASLGGGYSDASSANHESNPEPNDSGLSDSSVDTFGMSVLDSHIPLGNLKTSFDNSAFLTATENSMPYTTKSWAEQSIKYEIDKAKAKYSSDPLLSVSAKSDQIKDRMQSLINLNLPSDTLEHNIPKYDYSREFHIDGGDVKTLTGNTYEWWPYFSHNPYEYEHMKIDSDIQKAKEKRYADINYDLPDRVIPVHESNDDYLDSYDNVGTLPPTYYKGKITHDVDNPVKADEPFFSFVLNDYFDKNKDDDHLTFKGVEWGTDFDADYMRQSKDHGKRDSPSNYYHDLDNHLDNARYDAAHNRIGESATERGYDRAHNFDKHENGESQKESHKSDQAHSGHNHLHLKDFVDEFANKFGNEDHKRHSNFSLKSNKENGEKRKGFRRVYHKDEYQEDNEFFDNTGNSANSEDSGSSSVHNGGSVAGVQSHAAAVLRNDANAFNNVGNTKHNKFANKHKGNDAKHGFDRDFNRYIDIAKQTAHRNKAAKFD